MFGQQFFVPGLAHSSYLLAGAETCAIVDPRRDIGIYLDAAREMGVAITHILETHLHADFISGHMDLAAATGARIVGPRAGQLAFKHDAVAQGDKFDIETMRIQVLDVPGHTPEHIAYVVIDKARGRDPVAVFCGDALFVGDVGRPDLFPGMATKLASKLYDSLHKRLMKLPDGCMVYPAHGAGSLCGRAMGAMRTSTIGYERRHNAALQIKDRKKFVRSLTHDMPPAPDHFSRCSAINGKGPTRVNRLPAMKAFAPEIFAARAKRRTSLLLDVRPYAEYGGLHLPGSFHVDIGGNFATFAGWVLPPDREILLVVKDAEQAVAARDWLRRVGLDKVSGFLDGGLFAWAKAGFPTASIPQLGASRLQALVDNAAEEPLQLVDVRSPSEFAANHIEGAINIPAPRLRTAWKELDARLPTAVLCSTGHRSSLACSLLENHGFTQIFNVAGGMSGYSAAGYTGQCPLCVTPHGPHFLG